MANIKRLIRYSALPLILIFTTIGCNKDSGFSFYEKDGNCINSNHSGYTTLENNGIIREYIMHIPSSYDSKIPTPLVISFHGYGGCASHFYNDVGDLNSVADSENFIVAYPQAVVGEKGDVYWNPGDNGSQNIQENDVYFIEQLISKISNDYNIEPSLVYAIGYSNGGMMAYGLACSRGSLIAAVGIMSGIMLPESCVGNEFTSVIHFHGIADDVLPYEGNHDYQSVQDVIDFWLNRNSIPISSIETTELNGGNVIQDRYMGGNQNTSVTLYTVNSEYDKPGGHVWFSEDIEGVSPNQILWEFLSSYSLDD